MKLLEESGIKENIMKVLEKNPDADIAEILEYEISKDENLEDVFLEEAHKCAVNALGEALAKAGEQIIDAFSSAFSGLFDDKN